MLRRNNTHLCGTIDSDDMTALMQGDFVHRNEEIERETKQLAAFLDALPTCHLATIGFDFSGGLKEEKVFCPCNHQQTSNWRHLVNVSIGEGECKNNGRFETPNALIGHLKSMKNCSFHQYVLQYLEELYSNWHSNNLKHKGLYCVGEDEYNDAVKQEKCERDM